ncbi:DUF406 family protein [Shewanella japonica]|uniref:DUF406 family protein n=1 Tax=Shewanella japonica TaxID=93973 RepID=UPI002494C94C|nr:DUF406 family protein [Shewanella japonica]
MIKTITQQEVQVSDSCNDCGSFVDIGTVIDEQDTRLILKITGDAVAEEAEDIITKAKTRFDSVKVNSEQAETDITVIIDFEFTAEKMIFQLENGL